jgi:hypothetical protein
VQKVPTAPSGQAGPVTSSVHPSPFVDVKANTPSSSQGTKAVVQDAKPVGPTAANAAAPAPVDVSQLRPFTFAARFLSLNGYLRLLMHNPSPAGAAPQAAPQATRPLVRDSGAEGIPIP